MKIGFMLKLAKKIWKIGYRCKEIRVEIGQPQ